MLTLNQKICLFSCSLLINCIFDKSHRGSTFSLMIFTDIRDEKTKQREDIPSIDPSSAIKYIILKIIPKYLTLLNWSYHIGMVAKRNKLPWP